MKTKYTKDILAPIVFRNKSIRGVMKDLGLRCSGGGQRHIKACIEFHEIDMSHFTGKGWNKNNFNFKRKTYEDYLVLNDPYDPKTQVSLLRRSLIEIGRPYICENCGQEPIWNEVPLIIQVHHINGNRWDDRIDNLQFLCPNCHSQTDTFGVKNINK